MNVGEVKGIMTSFSGFFTYVINESADSSTNSKRIVMNPAFRNDLGSDFRIFLHEDGCLRLYTEEHWTENADAKIEKLEMAERNGLPKKEMKKLSNETRIYFKSVFRGKMDKQGRITLTSDMLEHAGIKDEVVFVGMQRFIEIWEPEAFERSLAEDDE